MNIGTILDELGLDALSPGGPDDPDAGPKEPLDDEEEADTEDSAETTDEEPSSGELFGDGEPADEMSEEIADIEHELDQVRNQVEQNSASIDGLESEQDNVGERLDRIEEHNATLLGVYDHLTESVNPFTGDWEGDVEQPDEAESKFDVIPGPDDETDEDTEPVRDTGGTVDPDPVVESEPEPDPAPEPTPDRMAQHSPSGGSTMSPQSLADDDGPYLTRFAATYATEVLLMEWLTMLVDRSGQEGALKALDHYDRIDWISEPVKRDLEVMLSGADCESDTPPRNDLNTDVHDRSFKYIARLSQQAQLEQSDQLR